MMTARIPAFSRLWRAVLPAGGVAALLLVLAMAVPAPSVVGAIREGPAQQAEVRDPGRLAVLRPQNPVPVVRRGDRSGDRRATPHYPAVLELRPTGLAAPLAHALRRPSEPLGSRADVPTKHVRARAPPAAA